MTHYLGVDFGSKNIGLATADSETRLAVPIESIRNTETVSKQIQDYCEKHSISTIVVGMPRSFDQNHINERMKATQEFVSTLAAIEGVTIETESELFTSKLADTLHSTGAGDDIHSKSAMLLLQTYIDRAHGVT